MRALLTTRRLLCLLLAAATLTLGTACKGSNPADPIVEPGPPALEPRAVSATASSTFLRTSEPATNVTISIGFENLDISELGQVPLQGQMRIDYVASGVQSLTLPLPAGMLATGTDPGPFSASLHNSTVLAQEVTPGQTVQDLLAGSSVSEYALVLALSAKNSKGAVTNTVSTDVPRPQLTGLSVAGGARGQVVDSVLFGRNLLEADRIVLDGTGVTAELLGPAGESSVSARFTVASSAAAGSHAVRVITPGGISAVSSAVEFEVIIPVGPQFVAQSLPAGDQGTLYQEQLVVAGGSAPLAFSLVSGALPSGMTLSSSTGELTGTSSVSGNFNLIIGVSDALSLTDQIPLSLVIRPPAPDGRNDLSALCDRWADAVVASNNATLPARATGSPDTVNAVLLNPMSPAIAGQAASILAPLTQVADLDADGASYIVFDLGDVGCEWAVASLARGADILLNDPDGYADAAYVWVSNDPAVLEHLVYAPGRNTGTFTASPVGVDLNSVSGIDGQRFRYVLIASNDAGMPEIDNLEILPEDTTGPATTLLSAQKVTVGLVPADNGTILEASVQGDDLEGGQNPVGVVTAFNYDIRSLTSMLSVDSGQVMAGMTEMATIYSLELPDDDYELQVASVDASGNPDATPATFQFTVDTTPPTVLNLDTGGMSSFFAPTDGFASIPVTADVTDGGSGVFQVDVLPVGPGSPEPVLMLPATLPEFGGTFDETAFVPGPPQEGSFILVLRAEDNFGNVDTSQSVMITVDINNPPTVVAGMNDTVAEGAVYDFASNPPTVMDAEAHPVTLSWTQVSGPEVLLTGADTTAPVFTAPLIGTNTSVPLVFELTATDTWNGVGSGQVTITVINNNQNPVADAGADKYVKSGVVASLNAGASYDPDQDSLTAGWVQTLGPPVTLDITGPLTAQFTAPNVGDPSCPAPECTLAFGLTVFDGNGGSAMDTVQVTVRDMNVSPVADAGPDLVALDGDGLIIDGSGSFDPDGSIAVRTWSLISGDSAHILNWSSLTKSQSTLNLPRFIGGVAETFIFELQVIDNQGASSTDQVTVQVEHYCAQTFSLIDRPTNQAEPSLMALDSTTMRVYALAPVTGGGLDRLDAAGGDAITRLTAPGTVGATDLQLNSVNGRLYWAGPGVSSLFVMETGAGNTTTNISLGAGAAPSRIALDTSSGRAFVLDRSGSGKLIVITGGLAVAGQVSLSLVDAAAAQIAYEPVSGLVLVLDPGARTLVPVDPVGMTVMGSASLPGAWAVDGLRVEGATGRLLVTNERGFYVTDNSGAVQLDVVLAAPGGAAFDVLPAQVGGYYFAANHVRVGDASSNETLYKVDGVTGSLNDSVVLSMLPVDTAARAGLAYDSGSGLLAVLEGRAAGQSILHLVDPATLSISSSPGLGGGESLSLAVMASTGRFYVLSRGRSLERVNPGMLLVEHFPLGFQSTDIAVDTVSGNVFVSGGNSSEIRLVMPGNPVAVMGSDVGDNASALLAAPDRGEAYSLGLARNTSPDQSAVVRRYDGMTASALLGPFSTGSTTRRSDLAHDPTDGTGGVLYVADPAGNTLEAVDLDGGPLTRSIPLPVSPQALLAIPSRGEVWASAFAGNVLVRVDVAGADTVQVVPALPGPAEMVFNPVSGLIYVRCELADRILAVDPDSATVVTSIDAGPLTRDTFGSTRTQRTTLRADSVTGLVYVLRGSGGFGVGVSVIDPPAAHAVTYVAPFGSFEPQSMVLDETRQILFVVDSSPVLHLVLPGQNFASFDFSIPQNPVDSGYSFIEIDATAGMVYVASAHTLSITHIDGICGGVPFPVMYGLLDQAQQSVRYASAEVPQCRESPVATIPFSHAAESEVEKP